MDHEALRLLVVARIDLDFPFQSEFLCVFDEIDQDLLYSSFIAIEEEWEFPFDLILYFLYQIRSAESLPWPYKEQTVVILIFFFYLVFAVWELQVL